MKLFRFPATLALLFIAFIILQFASLFLFNTHHRFDAFVVLTNARVFLFACVILYVYLVLALYHLKEPKWYLYIFCLPGIQVFLTFTFGGDILFNGAGGVIFGMSILTALILCFFIHDRKASFWFRILAASSLITLLVLGVGIEKSVRFENPNIFILTSIVVVLPIGVIWKLNTVLTNMSPLDADVYLLDEDQPTNCPQCGTRTNFYHAEPEWQKHHCPGCSYNFIGTFNKEETEPAV
jgi:hypothetical protein